MRIKDKTNFWWVWSPRGPADDGIRLGRHFENGMIRFPVPGDVASELEFQGGFRVKEYEAGDEFSEWEREGNRWRAIFRTVDRDQPMLPDIDSFEALPDELPDEWIAFMAKYTAKGRLKKQYRG